MAVRAQFENSHEYAIPVIQYIYIYISGRQNTGMAVLTGLEQNWCLFVPYEFVCGCCCWRIGELLQVCSLFNPANGKDEKANDL